MFVMQMQGEVTIAAPRDQVWAALNDPDVLARCIEGCESLTRDGDGFAGKMAAKVGPVRANFAGSVKLEDVVAGERYRLVGEGKGGVAGFAKGSADVALADAGPGQTLLTYNVSSQVGGKLAQLGARLIEGAARQYADGFFTRLAAELAPAPAETAVETPAAPTAAQPAAPAASGGGISPLAWALGLVALVAAFLWWQWQ
jgi:carbon monoxide dehydrogenase subunit G